MKKFILVSSLLISSVLVAYADIPNAGIGVVLQECENKVCIGNVLPHSSANEKGLKIGDIIVEIVIKRNSIKNDREKRQQYVYKSYAQRRILSFLF